MGSCGLTLVCQIVFLLVVALTSLCRGSLTNLLLLHFRNLTAHQNARRLVVHVVNHAVPELRTLQFEDQQWVFLLVRSILYTVAKFVQLSQILFPILINDVQNDALLELFHDVFGFRVVGFFKVARNLVHTLSVGNRHGNSLKPITLFLLYLLDNRPSNRLYPFSFTLESRHGILESTFGQIFGIAGVEFFFGERTFHRQGFQEVFLATYIIIRVDDVDTSIPNDVRDVHTDTLTHQCVAPFLVNHGALFVHHVIVFQQMLTNTEVVFFHFLLCALDALRNHRALNALSIFESQAIHHRGDAFRTKQSHQFIFQTDVEYRTTWVALTACTTSQLAVYTAAFVAFGTDDGQTSRRFHFGRQLDVGTTTGHVGGDGHRTKAVYRLSGLCHDVGFLLV